MVHKTWKKWLNRRTRGRTLTWRIYEKHLNRYLLLHPRIRHLGPVWGVTFDEPCARIELARVCEGRSASSGRTYTGTKVETADTAKGIPTTALRPSLLGEARSWLALPERITSRDGVGYGRPQEGRMNLLEEVSRLLNAYAKRFWLLTPGFYPVLLAGYQGRSPCLVKENTHVGDVWVSRETSHCRVGRPCRLCLHFTVVADGRPGRPEHQTSITSPQPARSSTGRQEVGICASGALEVYARNAAEGWAKTRCAPAPPNVPSDKNGLALNWRDAAVKKADGLTYVVFLIPGEDAGGQIRFNDAPSHIVRSSSGTAVEVARPGP